MSSLPVEIRVAEPVNPLQRDLATRIMRLTHGDGVEVTSVPDVALIRSSSTSQRLPALYEPCLCFVVQGRKQAVMANDVFTYDAMNHLVVPVTLPIVSQILDASPERPYLCLRIKLDVALIGELLLDLGPTAVANPGNDRALYIARTSGPLLDAIVRLVHLLEEPRDAKVLAPLVLREIHYRALTGELGERLRELCLQDSQTQRVARAIAMLRSRFTEAVRIEDLAEAAHMSTSSLHHRFKALTAMSPVQFQKHLRLHEARRLMLTDGLDASAAAHRVGYESSSQFSREYRRLFGAPPRTEIRNLTGRNLTGLMSSSE
jgi:AraC-like DNA-binding protein